MKRTPNYLLAFLVCAFIISCKEIAPYIDFNEKVIGLRDTTYVTPSIPNPIMTNIYIEDLTGVRCNNCPKAADKIKEIKAANPTQTVSLGVYPYALTNLMAPYPGFDTLNTNEADNIFSAIYTSPSAIPTGGVNRKIFSGETSTYFSYNKWAGYADMIKVVESPVIIGGEVLSYDDISRKARVRVKVVFTKAVTEELNLSLFLTESKILSKQMLPDGTTKDDYVHNHVLRKAVTPFNGVPMKKTNQIIGNYEAGRVFEKDFEVTLKSKWVSDNCGFVILVNRFDAGSKEVYQAMEMELK